MGKERRPYRTRSSAGYVYPLEVNFDIPLEKLIKQGKFLYLDSNINSQNFPLPAGLSGKHKIEVYLPNMGGAWSSEKGEVAIAQRNLRQGIPYVMLAFTKEHAYVLCRIWPVGFGQSYVDWEGERTVPRLHAYADGLDLGLSRALDARVWHPRYRPFGWQIVD